MTCKKCGQEAVIRLKAYNLALCRKHFEEFFISKTSETIRRYRLFSKDDLIMVAVSGGKDSLTLWYVLNLLGYRTHGFHIDLGISGGSYSSLSRKKTEKFAEKHGLSLTVVSVADHAGFTIDDYRRLGGRSACATCGIVKRYLMNEFAKKTGASCVATGHNLDDEAGVLLGNLLNWQLGYLQRQHPKLPASADFFAARVKPFAERTEQEVAAFAFLNGIDYIYDECPYSKGATSLLYKKVLNDIEEQSPGTKLRFFRGFLANKKLFAQDKGKTELVKCVSCGQPTVSSPCSFCRLMQKAVQSQDVRNS